MKKMSRMTHLMVLVSGIAMALTAGFLSAADRVRVGQWEVVSTNNGRTTTFKQCVGAVEAGAMNGDAKFSRAFFEKNIPASCKFTDYRVEGNSAYFTMNCGSVTIRSVTKYHGDGYETESMTKSGGAAETVSHVTAKRIRNCPPQ
ncbi:MAG: DUF3617 family protein [Acidobacteriota bacterium]|nr:DUF3617 family protein [Acidobacteriota bacterium]